MATNNEQLLDAAKYALKVIAEFNAGGTIETERQMKEAQQKLFSAVRASDPAYCGIEG